MLPAASASRSDETNTPTPISTIGAPERPDDPLLASAARQLAAYFAGDGDAFEIGLDLQGTPFQQAVWAELLRIAPGTTCSYGAVARRLGTASSGRAVGSAVGRNPVSIIVPHDGDGGGVDEDGADQAECEGG